MNFKIIFLGRLKFVEKKDSNLVKEVSKIVAADFNSWIKKPLAVPFENNKLTPPSINGIQ